MSYIDLKKGDQKTVAATSLSGLDYFGQTSAEGAYAVALVPSSLEPVIYDNLTYLGLEPTHEHVKNDYLLENGALSIGVSGVQKLIKAGVDAPVFEAMQGKRISIKSLNEL
jgi:hypothetical protein